MKRLSFLAIICLALLSLTSCGFNEKTAGELTDKFQSDPSSLTDDDWKTAFDLALKATNNVLDQLDDILDMDRDDRADAVEDLLESPEYVYMFKFNVMCAYAIAQDKVKGDLKEKMKEIKKLRKEVSKKLDKIIDKIDDDDMKGIDKAADAMENEFNKWCRGIKYGKDFDYKKLIDTAEDNDLELGDLPDEAFAEAPQEEEAEEEEIEYIEPEEEIPEVEELVEQTMNTEQIDIVEVVDKDKALKTDNELKEATNIGNANVSEGNEDYTEQNQVLQEVKVVEEPKPVEKPKPVKAKVFDAVEHMPTYPGGEKALAKYLSSNLSYPEEATADGASGKVIVQFVVNEDGSVTDVKVARGKHPALDREAVRVVKRMPKWNPGKHNGHSVKVRYTLSVVFTLQNQ